MAGGASGQREGGVVWVRYGWCWRRLAALARGAGEAPAQRVRQVASRCSSPRPQDGAPTPTQVSPTFMLVKSNVL